MKKILSLMALLLLTVTTAWAATVDELVAVGPGYTFIADNITSNGTVKLTANTLYDNDRIFAPTSNNISTKKGTSTIAGESHLNSLRLKNGQDYLIIKVDGPCLITFYTYGDNARGVKVGTSDPSYSGDEGCDEYGRQTAGTTQWTCNVTAAGYVKIASYNSDFYIAGFEVTASSKTVYFDNTATQWGKVNIWAWNDTENFTGGKWPGVEMETTETDNLYKWTTTGNPEKIIFNDGTNQTANLNFVAGATYNVNGQVRTVTFTTDAGWTEAWAYVYSGQDEEATNMALGNWPGTQMTSTGEGTWTISFGSETVPEKIIFHNNAGTEIGSQDFEDGKAYEYNQNHYTATFTTDKAWEEVYAYAWSGDDEGATKYLGNWPGTKLEATAGVYTVAIDTYGDAPEKILFNNGKGESDPQKEQTPDWTFVNEKAYDYSQHTYTATFTTDAGWENVYAYAWTGDGDAATKYLGNWPGTELTAGEGGYTVTINTYEEVAPAMIQFNNGDAKTNDQTFVAGKAYKYITATPLYALKEGDTFTAGTTVEVKDAENDVVATLTYGEDVEDVVGTAVFEGASNGNGANDDYAGFEYMTQGNGINGDKAEGTFYTIVPVYDGTITVGVRLNGGKKFYIKEDGTSMPGYDGITIATATNTSYSFPVKAGSEYKVYCAGSKLGFFGFDYTGYTKPELRFKVAGSMTSWGMVNVRADSYTFENLAADTEYKFKVIDNGVWKSYSDLTDVATGLYTDNDGNVCFKLNEAGNVTVNYKSGELFTVEGDFVLPQVVLAGIMNGWSTTEDVLEPAVDKKTTSKTVNLAAGNYEFKMIVDGNWLTREGESESQYELHRGWRTVDGVSQSSGKNMLLKADVAGDYTFTWKYATNTLTVTFPTGNLTLNEEDDNTDALTEWDGTSANVTLTRTLKTGMWNTFAAPFSIEIPTGWTVKELTATSYDANENKVTMTFGDAEGIEAGKPYLVKVNTNDDLQLDVFSAVTVDKTVKAVTSLDYVNFIPTLGKTTIEGVDAKKVLFLAAENKLKNPDEIPTDMKGFRAYFLLKDEAANARVFNLDLGEGETTGISTMTKNSVMMNNDVYDLQGRRVQNAAQKGVYIMNGRKVVKK